MIYELIDGAYGSQMIKGVQEDGKILWIPLDPANSDYQRYLRWLEDPTAEEGGTLS